MPDQALTIQAQMFRFMTSQILDRAEDNEPTVITRSGVPVAVVISFAEWERLNATLAQD